MAMYRYVKAVHKPPMPRPVAISYVLISIGFALMVWTSWPILSFFFVDQVVAKTVSPVGDLSGNSEASVPLTGGESTTNVNTWFPTKPQKKVSTVVNSYTLSIPSLGIDNATVIIAGDDLTKSLIHYGGTGIPGDYGNTVIFGHSTLPQFFRGTKDYKALFATLPTIKPGAEIKITYDSVNYTYIVYDKVVLEPTDLTGLEQSFDDSYVTLVTCVPPGTYLYRLNVRARLKKV